MFANFCRATLASGGINTSSLSMRVAYAEAPYQNFPLEGGKVVVTDSLTNPSKFEIISYQEAVDDTTNSQLLLKFLQRGLEGTTGENWPDGAYVYLAATAEEMNRINQVPTVTAGDDYSVMLQANSKSHGGTSYPALSQAGLVIPASDLRQTAFVVCNRGTVRVGFNFKSLVTGREARAALVKNGTIVQQWSSTSVFSDQIQVDIAVNGITSFIIMTKRSATDGNPSFSHVKVSATTPDLIVR